MNGGGDAAAESRAEELIKENEKKAKSKDDDKGGFRNADAVAEPYDFHVHCGIDFRLSYDLLYRHDEIPAAAVSLILVLSKVLDGVTDLFAGFIVDKTKTRWGKARPYEVFVVGLMFCTFAFPCPESFSTIAKCIWILLCTDWPMRSAIRSLMRIIHPISYGPLKILRLSN